MEVCSHHMAHWCVLHGPHTQCRYPPLPSLLLGNKFCDLSVQAMILLMNTCELYCATVGFHLDWHRASSVRVLGAGQYWVVPQQ